MFLKGQVWKRYKALRMLEDGKEPDDLKLKAAYMKAQGILERFNVSGDHFIESRTLSVFQKSDLISKNSIRGVTVKA